MLYSIWDGKFYLFKIFRHFSFFFLLPTLVNIYNKIHLGEQCVRLFSFSALAMSVFISVQWLLYHNAKQVRERERERECVFFAIHTCVLVLA
jgi:hypothetical protein